jgi:hypothetical protein
MSHVLSVSWFVAAATAVDVDEDSMLDVGGDAFVLPAAGFTAMVSGGSDALISIVDSV